VEILIAKKGRLKRNTGRWLYGAETEEEGASETPKAPTKVEVVGAISPTSRKGEGKSGRHVKRNKCLAATVTKRKESRTRVKFAEI